MIECYKAYYRMKWKLLRCLLIIYKRTKPKNKHELGSPTPGIWNERQVKVILDPWYRYHLEVNKKEIILKMFVPKRKNPYLLHRGNSVHIIDHRSGLLCKLQFSKSQVQGSLC